MTQLNEKYFIVPAVAGNNVTIAGLMEPTSIPLGMAPILLAAQPAGFIPFLAVYQQR